MRTSRIMKFACTAAVAAALASSLTACGQNDEESAASLLGDPSDLSGGVAASVNDVEIGENAVTSYIASFRSMSGLTDDAAWAQWLVDQDYTVEAAREDIVNLYIDQELLRQAAESQGVTVSSEDVDAQINAMKANFDSEEAWQQALENTGTTEATYRSMLEQEMLKQGLFNKVATATEPSTEEMLSYAQMYAAAYDGAKKSSHILFNSSDEATAQEVLDKINAGELDFAEAAAQYSTDSASAVDGGNVGWNCMATFVTEYSDALNELDEGEVSGLVVSEFGIHIIKCTEVFNAPEEVTSLDQIPSEFVDSIKSSLESSSKSASYKEWMADFKTNSNIVISDMPEDLPYDVDLTGYTKTETTTLPDTGSADDAGVGDADADNSAASGSDDGDGASGEQAEKPSTE